MPKRKHAAAAEGDASADGMVVLHRSNFIEWQPTPIVALASSADGSLAVALRENGDLELYETGTAHPLQRLPGHADAAPTSVAVVDQGEDAPCRVFTAGLDGMITEVDLEGAGAAGVATDSSGGAVWALAVEPTPPEVVGEQPPAAAAQQHQPPPAGGNSSDSDDDGAAAAPRPAPRLAAACDDGCVRLFTVEPGVPGAVYARALPRVEGRTLAVAWHPSAKYIVSAGSDGCIHVWDAATGRESLRITAGDGSGADICVWALLVLPDGTIVAGDSAGGVTFWDGRFGTLLGRFTQHDADVLALAAAPDGSAVFAAGVDPRVSVFQRLRGQGPGGKPEWAFLSSKRPHTHDVRAMCVAAGRGAPDGGALLTGGNDTVLLAHSVRRFLKEHPRKADPCPQRPLIAVAPAARVRGDDAVQGWLMAAAGPRLDLWQLSRPAEAAREGAAEGARLAAEGLPLHLARWVNRGGEGIAAAAVARDGRFVAFSDAKRLRCFAVDVAAPPRDLEAALAAAEAGGRSAAAALLPRASVRPVALPDDFPAARHIFFPPAGDALVAVAADGTVRVLALSSAAPEGEEGGGEDPPAPLEATLAHTIRELHDLRYKMWFKRDRARSAARRAAPAVDLAALSPDGRLLAAAVRGRVHLLPLDGHKVLAAIPPPSEAAPLAALGFTPDGAALVTVTAANHVAAYQVPSGAAADWSRDHPPEALPRRVLTMPGPVVGVAASPAGPSAVLLHSAEAVVHVDLAAPAPAEPAGGGKARRRRRDAAATRTATPAGENCRALYCADPVLHVEALGGGQVVVVERAWADVHRGLAPPMYRHRYGT